MNRYTVNAGRMCPAGRPPVARTKLSLCIQCLVLSSLSFGPTVFAQDHDDDLEEVIVTATPLNNSVLELSQSTTVLTGETLAQSVANTIGETVNKIPGVQSAYFGAGVGRPIIRGLDGPRVDILENNISTNDVSAVSVDHAVTVEPFLADQIEVLRGPATLLYGSETIGGIVNVRTNRIHQNSLEGFSGKVEVRGDSVADETFAAVRLDAGANNWNFHFDAFTRDAEDYDIPGLADRSDPDAGRDTLINSGVETDGGAFGVSYTFDKGYVGLSYSKYDNFYGIPGAEEEVEDDGSIELAFISLDIEQEKISFEFGLEQPLEVIENFQFLYSDNDYTHIELEGDEQGTLFINDAQEGRFELTHIPLGIWRGAFGLQFSSQDLAAFGEEAFIPPTESDNNALFIVEEAQLNDTLQLTLGARIEDVDYETVAGLERDFSPFSLSAGLVWQYSDNNSLAANFSRAERAPNTESLFANGPHLATQTFEIGNPDLDEETSNSFELSLRHESETFRASITGYFYDFSDFIFLSETGLIEDELPVRIWTQEDADFSGFEAEAEYLFEPGRFGQLSVNGLFDTVSADLDNGDNVPRLAPARIGGGLNWKNNDWNAGLSVIHYDDQDDTAPLETPTDGYTLVNADVSYSFNVGDADWQLYLRARNLNDEEARNHTSFLKDIAPLPGRNFIFGLKASF